MRDDEFTRKFAIALIVTTIVWIGILCASCIAVIDALAAPNIIMNGQYVENVVDINEAPPISNVSNALDAIDALDDTPYNVSVPLDFALQKHIWQKCKEATGDYKNLYAFMIGLIDQESEFNPYAVSKTNDYGLCQTNKKWVYPDVKKVFGLTDITDCFNPYVSVDCCFWELSKKINSYGVSERLYYYYNTGNTSGSSNKNSRAMIKKWAKWESIIWGS